MDKLTNQLISSKWLLFFLSYYTFIGELFSITIIIRLIQITVTTKAVTFVPSVLCTFLDFKSTVIIMILQLAEC